MTVPTDELKVVEAESDLRIVDVLRRDVRLVMDDHSGRVDPFGETALTQSLSVRDVSCACLLPGLGFIKRFCVWFHCCVNPTEDAVSSHHAE